MGSQITTRIRVYDKSWVFVFKQNKTNTSRFASGQAQERRREKEAEEKEEKRIFEQKERED